MKQELRFSPRVEAALRELAGLPWTADSYGVRCERACPVAAAVEAETGERCGLVEAGWDRGPLEVLGWTRAERAQVRNAADWSGDPRYPRLLELLGVAP